ncbi:hypothetical protein [Streptomyces sp. NBC_01257]|uniref:hypothetical protein n=1 Tax=Streptomyces sp. NBC_01257 TaxID=2903799 RepID=UPI002DD7B32F|nr:hypothetical protein [Streptomyces sp. NBC_01257]WRZ66542.1 hypothetical protein OG408_22925 [Streptomyces sp. NBC_01257]
MSQASSGAAGALGGAAGAEASRLVRERLVSSPEGRAALDPADGDPDEASRLITAALTEDPEFARRLEQLREASRQQPSAAPTAGRDIYQATVGERARHNTIAFGPLTLRKDRAPVTLTALLLVVALVLGFAVYGLAQALGGDDSDSGSPYAIGGAGEAMDSGGSGAGSAQDATAGGAGGKSAPVRNPRLAKGILPDLRSMPSGWSLAEEAETRQTSEDSCSGDCGGLLSEGEVTYAPSGTSDLASILVEAYESAEAAATGYETRVDDVGSAEDVSSMSLDQLGDVSAAFSRQEYTGSAYKYSMATVVRAGTVVLRVTYGGGYEELNSSVLTGIASMVTERAHQAQNGEDPSAVFAEAP